jgi:hypothetical protein
MIFDKSKVYSALDADEVKVGSKGYFGDSISGLKNNMEDGKILTVGKIWEENNISRFQTEKGLDYIFFYLVEKPKYRPYESTDEMVEDFKERARKYNASFLKCPMFHPSVWIKEKNSGDKYLITGFIKDDTNIYCVLVGTCFISLDILFKSYTYLDGSPCGKKI